MEQTLLNPAKAWLAEFRLMNLSLRLLLNGRPLYSYHVTYQEYQQLEQVLQLNKATAFHPVYHNDWATCFCLYVAEYFRREYDGSYGWSWDPIWEKLGYKLTISEYQHLVESGLKKWQRPMRYDARGRNFLGSLFAEGGLPWPLVQTDHGFGVLIRRGLSRYYGAKALGQPLSAILTDYAERLPQSFRNIETYRLLEGIIKQLIDLVELYPLQSQIDPAAYLDQQAPNWRSNFPLPLDELNARHLINDWLRNAEKQYQEQEKKCQDNDVFKCHHVLLCETQSKAWLIKTTLQLPRKITLPLLNRDQLVSTRFELAFYEGDQLLKKAGVVYANIISDERQLELIFNTRQFILNRQIPDEPLKLCFFQNGQRYDVLTIDDSSLLQSELPLVFAIQNEEWVFVNQASCRIKGDTAIVSVPAKYQISSTSHLVLQTQANGIRWLEITGDTYLSDRDEQYIIRVKHDKSDPRLLLRGKVCLYDTLPSLVYHGLPEARLEGQPIPSDWRIEVNGKPITQLAQNRQVSFCGLIEYRIFNPSNEIVFKQKFGILPVGFLIQAYPAHDSRQSARLLIAQGQGLALAITGQSIDCTRCETINGTELVLKTLAEEQLSHLSVRAGSPNAAINIIIPYPFEGVVLTNAAHEKINSTEMSLDSLLGLRATLSSAHHMQQSAIFELSLIRNNGKPLKLAYRTAPYQTSTTLSLFAYQDKVMQLLSSVDDQDAYVKITIIQNGRELKQLNIRRYQAVIEKMGTQQLSLHYASTQSKGQHTISLQAMRLANPQQHSVHLIELQSQTVGTGFFEIPAYLERQGPWLVYSPSESPIAIRPFLYISLNARNAQCLDKINSLHHAAELFHPQLRPAVIEQQIEKMAQNLNHSGWQYLTDLKNGYAHLPLSTFEVWKELVRQPCALAMSLFKLEIDSYFCDRMQNELAVLWETVPIPVWVKAYAQFKTWLSEQGSPQSLVTELLANREQTLNCVVSGFEHLQHYLNEPDCHKLRVLPITLILTDWYQDLRRRHALPWPVALGPHLKRWIMHSKLPVTIKTLSQSEETDAVVYLPIFMAYISTGHTNLAELPVPTDVMKLHVQLTADFDRLGWYNPVHSMMVCHFLTQQD